MGCWIEIEKNAMNLFIFIDDGLQRNVDVQVGRRGKGARKREDRDKIDSDGSNSKDAGSSRSSIGIGWEGLERQQQHGRRATMNPMATTAKGSWCHQSVEMAWTCMDSTGRFDSMGCVARPAFVLCPSPNCFTMVLCVCVVCDKVEMKRMPGWGYVQVNWVWDPTGPVARS